MRISFCTLIATLFTLLPPYFAGQIPASFVYLGQTNDKFVEGEFLQHWVWAGTRKVIRLQPITYSIVLIWISYENLV